MEFEKNSVISPKNETPIQKVVSVNEKNRQITGGYFKEIFENSVQYGIERDLQEDELNLIEQINRYMKDFVESYGGDHVDISPDNITFIDPDKLSKEAWRQLHALLGSLNSSGMYAIMNQKILLLLLNGEDKYDLASILSHELMHMYSFNSVNANSTVEGDVKVSVRRIGLEIHDAKGSIYFEKLNEAMAEEMNHRFESAYFDKIPQLQGSLEHKIELKKNNKELFGNVDRMSEIRTKIKKHKRTGIEREIKFRAEAYAKERAYLNKLIDDIYAKNKNTFTTREDVFKIFAEAFFTGKALTMARLIDKTYGKGAFRKIGEETMAEVPKGYIIINEIDGGYKSMIGVE